MEFRIFSMSIQTHTAYHGIIIIYIYLWFKGVYKCRAGWASLEQPQLVFKNITAKQKGKKVLIC